MTGARTRRRVSPGVDNAAGWMFVSPMVLVLGLFLVLPILMAAWVSLLDWNTNEGDPFAGAGEFVGMQNYRNLLVEDGLARQDFMTSIRNNLYYVAFVVPTQTALALLLATLVNARRLKGRGFFRTAFYFPSITSSVAISIVFVYLFVSNGGVNKILALLGLAGPAWLNDSRGVFQILLDKVGLVDIDAPPAWLADSSFLGLPWWEWLAGPSVAMSAIMILVVWTTSGTFMLMFVAALQDIPAEIDEAALIDGAGAWQKFRHVTLPQLRPVTFLVLTLGLISTWQVFDQILIMTQGGPEKTTLSPAYLSYSASFTGQDWGGGAAISFILFGIILALTLLQRRALRGKESS
ncbi:MAG TPA: sugar ABC transporter permease [Nocardioidaceae bacterium]|nr:sugar ABC transporter permease [Nocardioidaceae bacterium]